MCQVAYEGVPFLSRAQEDQIRKELGDNTMLNNVERSLSYREEEELQNCCSRVAQWIPQSAAGALLEIPVATTDYCLKYFLHKEVRARFKDVWTFQQDDKVY